MWRLQNRKDRGNQDTGQASQQNDRMSNAGHLLLRAVNSVKYRFATVFQLVYVCVSEVRSLRGRISLRLGGMTWIPICRAKRSETFPSERRFLSTADLDRSEDMQQMLATHQWASLADCYLFAAGWDKGAQGVSRQCNLDWDIRV